MGYLDVFDTVIWQICFSSKYVFDCDFVYVDRHFGQVAAIMSVGDGERNVMKK